ncbi:hypothetical protein AB3X96_30630 [Paraburkholderia sp. BR13439]|uniref:hypothetical protein n=1 Tax=Paraburkholderia sp. BR13439 TaxID=3236996 RepID=UPI0034CF6EF2
MGVYDLSAGDVPDFTLADMTGALISSFLVGKFFSLAIIGYLLFAGLSTRKAITEFYSNDKDDFDKNATYLFRGKFIIGVTLLDVILWAGFLFKPFDMRFAPTTPGVAGVAYKVALWSSVALVLLDWRRGRRVLKYLLCGALGGAVAFLAVLLIAYWAGLVIIPATPGGSAVQHQIVPRSSAFVALMMAQCQSLLSGDAVLTTAVSVGIAAAVITIALGLATRKRREANLAGETRRLLVRNETARLVIAKLIATAVFCFVSMIGVIIFLVIIDASPRRPKFTWLSLVEAS